MLIALQPVSTGFSRIDREFYSRADQCDERRFVSQSDLEDQAFDLEDRVFDLEDQHSGLEDQAFDLEDQHSGLEDQAFDLEDQIFDLEEQLRSDRKETLPPLR